MTINNRLSKYSKKSILKDINLYIYIYIYIYIYDICEQYADDIATYNF